MSLEALHAEVQSYRTEAGRLAELLRSATKSPTTNLTITGKRNT